MRINHLILLSLILFCWQGCAEQGSQDANPENEPVVESKVRFQAPGFEFPYRLAQPYATYELDTILTEISGLAWLGTDQLICVQDEMGVFFTYNLKNRSIIRRQEFAAPGDFEGCTVAGDELWALRSDGTLFRTSLAGKTEEYANPLLREANVEGLAYQPDRNRLLLACKDLPASADSLQEKRLVFGFDLAERALDPKPVFVIDPVQIPPASADKEKSKFKPSGVAVHPGTGNVYLVAHKGKLLVVLSPEGALLYAEGLDKEQFPQPEGICFSPAGTLHISTEGDGGAGRIVAFAN